MRRPRSVIPIGMRCAALALCTVSMSAQRGQPASDTVVQQVRTALGHGALDQAERLAASSSGAPASRELAAALVEIFQGKDDQARARLQPLAGANATGDAALELGLLELRHGRRAEAMKLLDPIAGLRTFNTPDDYFRLARAAEGTREYLLANDAFQRTADVKRADIQTAWGDLFLQRHQPGDAATSYQQAIQIDPAWLPAHIGLARALADDEPEAAAAEAEKVQRAAPEFPELWVLIAERQLAEEDFQGAAQSLDHLARIRPNSIDEAAMRAAAAYGLRRPADVDAAAAKVHDIDPTSARAYRAAAWQASQKYQFADAVAYGRKAVAIDDADPDAHADLGLYLLRSADEKGARTELERAWNLDKSNRVTLNLLTMLDRLDKFTVVPDGELIFKFPEDEAAPLKPYALPLGELAYKTFQQYYGFTPQGPILIEVFGIHDDFAVRTVGLPGIEGALGACFGQVISMDSPTARPGQPIDFSWQATLWHEMAHVFTLQLSKYRVPRWLTEGISVFEEHRRNPAWGRELTLQFARRYGQRENFTIKTLPEAFKHPETLSFAYFEAALMVQHLVELHGNEGLRTLLLAYADGADDSQAFTKAFGTTLDAVEASYEAFLDKNFGALRDAMKNPPRQVAADDLAGLETRATAAPGNYISQLALGQALVRGGDLARARVPLARAAALAPEAAGDDSPHALLAGIAMKQNDPAQARQQLRALLTWDHANIAQARQLVKIAADARADADEDFALRLVADLDPFDAEVHGTLGARLMAKNDYAAALTEFQVALALKPANLAVAHTDVAEALLKLNRRDEAKREAMLALEEAPTFARAQDILLAALGKDRR